MKSAACEGNELVYHVVRSIRALLEQQPLVFVATDGPGGAGKSTLANELSNDLDSAVVAVDDFYRVMDESLRSSLGPEAGYMQYFDWQRLRDQVLAPLRQGAPATYERFNWQSRRLEGAVEVKPRGVVIVEGVGSFRPELRVYYNYSIYVDAPRDVRLARLRARGDPEDWIRRWEAAQDWYVEHHDPPSAVDVVISQQP